MTDLSIKIIRAPTVVKSGSGGSMSSEIGYIINNNTNVGQQVEYRARVFDNVTFELLGEKKRFITIDPNDPFPNRSMNVTYSNFDSHPKILVDFQMVKGNLAISNAVTFPFEFDIPPPTVVNFSVTATFPDGHKVFAVINQDDNNELSGSLPQGVQINSTATTNPVTKTLSQFLIEIEDHIFGDLPPEPDENISVIIDMHDGHFIAGILTLADFNELDNFNEIGWNITDHVPTNEPTTDDLSSMLLKINAHILADLPEPDPDPDPTPDPVPNQNMVSQSLGVFNLENDRLTGEILYIAQSAFDPFFYGQTIFSLLSIRDKNGVDLVTKQNDLVFTELERDERITFDESAFGNIELHLRAFVFSLDNEFNALAFSTVKEFIVKEEDPPMPPPDNGASGDILSKLILGAPAAGFLLLMLNRGLRLSK